MVVRYEMRPEAAEAAFWYRWRHRPRFMMGALALGLVPALGVFAMAASFARRASWPAVSLGLLTFACGPFLLGALVRTLSKRGERALLIHSDGLTTEVPGGQFHAPWRDVVEIVETTDYVFFMGRGMHSISIPVAAFRDDADREEFMRRTRLYSSEAI
jgi:hypothetical protein